MWHSQVESLGIDAIRHVFRAGDQPVSYASVLKQWETDQLFRTWFATLLRDVPFAAYRWETPPLTTANIGRPFECVFLQCDPLDRPQDSSAFDEYFDESHVVTFSNLGGDATLVVPTPVDPHVNYSHLAAFVRTAAPPQADCLWKSLAGEMRSQLGNQPRWVSTAGMGISWLHLRIDSWPKYYGYSPYKHCANQ